MTNFGTIIIGVEILSGKCPDRHFPRVIETLARRGLELKWCRIIGDDPALIMETLRQTLARDDIVFCFGGIGATPDDHTHSVCRRPARADSIAARAPLPQIHRPEGGPPTSQPQRIPMGIGADIRHQPLS
ncbi:MAG: molybdopterin-binding protein [Sulfuricella sp.]